MRIVLTSDCFWPRVNGVTVAVQTLRKELLALGHEVLLVVPKYPDPSHLDVEDEEGILRVEARQSKVSPEDYLATRKGQATARQAILQFKPDIIHSHTEFALCQAAHQCSNILKCAFIMTSHTYFEQYISHYIPFFPGVVGYLISRNITYNKFKRAHLILTPGKEMVHTLLNYGLKQPIMNIPTGIDARLYEGLPRKRQRQPKPTLLYVGRVAMEKNVFFLLDVLKLIVDKYPDAHLNIIGDGPSSRELLDTARKKGLTDNITLKGYQPRERVIQEYALSDVFVFPSLTETQGLVSIEALMAGTPVVAISARGSAEVLVDGQGARLVPKDVQLFADRVLELLDSEDTWQNMSQKALEYSQGWTSNHLARRVEEIYQDLISKNNHQHREKSNSNDAASQT